MKVCRFFAVFVLAASSLSLVFVRAQPIDSSKEARAFFKKYTDKLNRTKSTPNEVIGTLRELEALGYEMRVVVPFRCEQMLSHRDPAVRRQAARTLASIGTDSFTASRRVEVLMRHLNDRDPEVVESLLLALALIGRNAKEALPKVLETFKHDDPRVRRQAMVFFTRFLPENKDLMPTIIAALDDPDVGYPEKKNGYGSVSMLALNALIRFGPEAQKVVPKLIQMVKSKKNDDFYEISVLNTLVRIKPDESFTLNIAREWLRNKDGPEHIIKGAGLIPRGNPGKVAVPELIAALELKPFAEPNLEQRVKLAILDALYRMGPDAKKALPALRALTSSTDPVVRRQAEKATGSIRGDK